MNQILSRRPLLKALVGGAIVLGFDPRRRSWVTEASASGPLDGVPALDGTLFVDAAHLAAAADDFGHIISHTPVAVLLPGSVADIAKVIRFARRHGLQVAMRGQGHAQFGQPQVQGGIVIDSSSLSVIHEIGTDFADVDAGVLWSALVNTAATHGLTPPVLTDYLELAVGGTLSVGGLGGTTQHFGLQVDNVLQLEVVTGEGDVVTCSRIRLPELFAAVLAGLGQCAIIVRAKVRLVPAQAQALVFHLFYDDINLYVHDQELLLNDGRFSYLEGQVVANPDGVTWRYMIEAASYFTPPAMPNQTALLAGLSDDRSTSEIFTQTYSDFAFRLAPLIEFLMSIGVWGFPHPWIDLWVPASRAASYVGGIIAHLTTTDTGQGPVLFYPIDTHKVQAPLYRLPDERIAFGFHILRTAAPPTTDVVNAMLVQNRTFYEQAVAVGGTRYSIGAIPFTRADWRHHFDGVYPFLAVSKLRFDPDNVLTPGQGIF
jgi:cytokinin dehydrogenase